MMPIAFSPFGHVRLRERHFHVTLNLLRWAHDRHVQLARI